MALPCPVCRNPVTYYDPASQGVIKANPCGHWATIERARAVYPEEMARIEEGLLEEEHLFVPPPGDGGDVCQYRTIMGVCGLGIELHEGVVELPDAPPMLEPS